MRESERIMNKYVKDNNPPYAIVELTQEQYDLLMQTCDVNHRIGLSILQKLNNDERIDRKTVALIERFKSIKEALERAKL